MYREIKVMDVELSSLLKNQRQWYFKGKRTDTVKQIWLNSVQQMRQEIAYDSESRQIHTILFDLNEYLQLTAVGGAKGT